jgi:hypothetical protein
MSSSELERVEVMGRVAKEKLKLIDAAAMLQLSYRQVKRLWRCYRQKGRQGLQHGHVGRVSNRSKPAKFRRRVLSLIRQKYSGSIPAINNVQCRGQFGIAVLCAFASDRRLQRVEPARQGREEGTTFKRVKLPQLNQKLRDAEPAPIAVSEIEQGAEWLMSR